MRLAKVALYVQAVFYVASGLNHFWHGPFYNHIMPDHYSHPEALVKLSGVAEILGGIGLAVPVTRRFSALGLALMLIVFLDVHIFMILHSERFPEVPVWLLWARLPLQGILIGWALFYARRGSNRLESRDGRML